MLHNWLTLRIILIILIILIQYTWLWSIYKMKCPKLWQEEGPKTFIRQVYVADFIQRKSVSFRTNFGLMHSSKALRSPRVTYSSIMQWPLPISISVMDGEL